MLLFHRNQGSEKIKKPVIMRAGNYLYKSDSLFMIDILGIPIPGFILEPIKKVTAA